MCCMLHLKAPVSQYQTSPVHSVTLDTDIHLVERRLSELSLSCLAVVNHAHLVGVVSRTDLLRVGRIAALSRESRSDSAAVEQQAGPALTLPHVPVREIMRSPAFYVQPSDPLANAAKLMMQHHIHRVFVVEHEHLVGVLSTRDLMRAVRDARVTQDVATLMSSPVLTVSTDAPVAAAIDQLAQAHVRGLVVVENEWPVGLFTQAEALAARSQPATTPVEEVMSYALLCLPPQTPAHRAAAAMNETRARRVVVVEHREVQGMVTGMDLAALVL